MAYTVHGISQTGILEWIAVSYSSPFLLAAAKSLQSCPTLCDPTDISPPGSPIPGILQARTLEWVAISFSNAWKWKEKVKSLSRVPLFATPWTAAYQAPPFMGFSRQEDWSEVPLPSPSVPTRFKFGPGWEGWYVSKTPLTTCREADRNCARLNSDSRSLIIHNKYLKGSLYHSKPQFSNLSNEDNFFLSNYSESVWSLDGTDSGLKGLLYV